MMRRPDFTAGAYSNDDRTRGTARSGQTLEYRGELDGLRAVAVIPVILFHAGIQAFAGGYVGVDVFFVISGYLITSIILQDIERDRFSIATFYERRARRILPALTVVALVSVVPAWVLMDPEQLREFGQSLGAVGLFGSNIFFWSQSGYFARAVDEKPLLHTWSLAVEEQFYLLFPLGVFALWRWGRRRRGLTVAFILVGAASFALSEVASRVAAGANFYWAPTRAWELMIGAMFATSGASYREWLRPSLLMDNLLAGAGGVLILAAVFWFDSTTRFPSAWALLPVVGTALILAHGRGETWIGRALSTRFLVGVGLISYSAYLCHQPLFAYARLLSFDPPPPAVMLTLAGVAIVLAGLSWKYVERPWRDRTVTTRPTVAVGSTAAIAAMVIIGAVLWIVNGTPDEVPNVFLFGDSHSLSVYPALEKVAAEHGFVAGFTGAAGCLPFLGIFPLSRDDQDVIDCHALNQRVFDYVKAKRIPTLVLAARWTYYTDGRYSNPNALVYIGPTRSSPISKAESRKTFVRALQVTVDAYAEAGTRVIIMKQVPMQLGDPRRAYFLASRISFGLSVDDWVRHTAVPVAQHDGFQRFVNTAFTQLEAHGNVEMLDPGPLFCSDDRCRFGDATTSYYYDDGHLSIPGSLRLVPLFERALPGRAKHASN
jgi:peptidoglycan/LPS O-acetylase OafA/YrhL